MSEDWYSFNGLPKDKIERAKKFRRENKPKINVDNKDWEIIINKNDPSKDQDENNFSNQYLRWLTTKVLSF